MLRDQILTLLESLSLEQNNELVFDEWQDNAYQGLLRKAMELDLEIHFYEKCYSNLRGYNNG